MIRSSLAGQPYFSAYAHARAKFVHAHMRAGSRDEIRSISTDRLGRTSEK